MKVSVAYSVVVPVYNGEESLEELCKGIYDTLQQVSFEIIMVDDGSTDKSWITIMRMQQQYPGIVKGIQLHKNFGQHVAVLCAFSYCKGEFVITIDDDLQHDPKDILLLLEKQKQTDADVVYGSILQKHHTMMRNVGSYYVRKTSAWFGSDAHKGSSFRLIRKEIADEIASNHRHNFVFIDEAVQWYTSSLQFVPVSHKARTSGKSGYSLMKLLRLYTSLLTSYSASSLLAMSYAGGVISILSFLMGIFYLYRKFMHHVQMGFTSIIVAILFSTGMILLSLGVIGTYLFRIYQAQQRKPLYSIKKIVQ